MRLNFSCLRKNARSDCDSNAGHSSAKQRLYTSIPLCCYHTGIESDDEYNPPPCSTSDKGSSMEEVQITESAPVYDDVTVSEGNFVTEHASIIGYACLLQNIHLLPKMSFCYKI